MSILKNLNLGQNVGIFFYFISLFLNFLIIILPLNFFSPEDVKLFRQILNIATVLVPIFILGIDHSVPILSLNKIIVFAKYHLIFTTLLLALAIVYPSLLSIALSSSIASIVVTASISRKIGRMNYFFFSTQLAQKILILVIVFAYISYKHISINHYLSILSFLCLGYSLYSFLKIQQRHSKSSINVFSSTALGSLKFGISAAFYHFVMRAPYFLLLPVATASVTNRYDLALACAQTVIMPSLMRSKYLDVIDNWSPSVFYNEIKKINNTLFLQEALLYIFFLLVLCMLSIATFIPFTLNDITKSYLISGSIVFMLTSYPNIPFVACRYLDKIQLIKFFIISIFICLITYLTFIQNILDIALSVYFGTLFLVLLWGRALLQEKMIAYVRWRGLSFSLFLMILSYAFN